MLKELQIIVAVACIVVCLSTVDSSYPTGDAFLNHKIRSILIAFVILTIDDNLVSGQCTVLYINKMSVQSTRPKAAVANRYAIQRIPTRQH